MVLFRFYQFYNIFKYGNFAYFIALSNKNKIFVIHIFEMAAIAAMPFPGNGILLIRDSLPSVLSVLVLKIAASEDKKEKIII